MVGAIDLAFKEPVADVSAKPRLSIDRSIFSSFNPSNPNSDNNRQRGWGQRSWSYFNTLLRILLILSLLFFFASPKKNEKRRPENDDSRFRVQLCSSFVQRGEGQRGNVERSSASCLGLSPSACYVAANNMLDLKSKLHLFPGGFSKGLGKKALKNPGSCSDQQRK